MRRGRGVTREAPDPPTPDEQSAIQEALAAARSAYAPYSGFHVGAYVRLEDGRAVAAANVENASYGLSICAETNAITSLIAGGHGQIALVVVVGYPAADPTARSLAAPCGRCRQVIAEFATPRTVVLVAYASGEPALRVRALDLLPHAFGPAALAGKA